MFDVATVWLQTVQANHQLGTDHEWPPYSRRTLVHILSGNDYVLLRDATLEQRRARRRRLLAFPTWAALATLPRRDARLKQTYGRLLSEGYITERLVPFREGQGTYVVPVLTERGEERLADGRVFDWEDRSGP